MILRKILLDLCIHYRNVVEKNNIGLISHIGIYYTALRNAMLDLYQT